MADSLLRDCGDGLLDSESGAHAIHIIADPTGTTDLVQAIARITLTAATHIDVPFNQIILAAGRSITTRLLDKRRLKLDAPRTAPRHSVGQRTHISVEILGPRPRAAIGVLNRRPASTGEPGWTPGRDIRKPRRGA